MFSKYLSTTEGNTVDYDNINYSSTLPNLNDQKKSAFYLGKPQTYT